MNCETMSEDMKCRLFEACENGDAETLRHAAKEGLVFFSAMLDRAAMHVILHVSTSSPNKSMFAGQD